MKLQCISRLEQNLLTAFPAAKLPEGIHLSPELCPPGMEGDITINCFRMTRYFGTKPDALAEKAAELLQGDPDVSAAASIKGFVNVTLKAAALFRDTVADVQAILEEGALPEQERKRIVIEYSAPNTNKPQHLGHVRNNTLGMSLASLLARVKHDVIPVNLVNDRGIHICKSMLAYMRFGNGATPESTGIKGDHFVGDFYVKYNSALSEQIKHLRAEHPELEEKDNNELSCMGSITLCTVRCYLDGRSPNLGLIIQERRYEYESSRKSIK